MRRMRAVCAIAISVLSTASFGAITAQAATQAQSQSVYSTQSQQVDTLTGGNVTQGETSTINSQQTETTQKQTPGQTVNSTNQSYIDSDQDHSVTGDGNYLQAQTSTASSSMNKTATDQSVQITTSANTNSDQQGSITAHGKSTIKQSDTSVILGSQSQTEQEQSVSGSYVHYSHESSVTTPPVEIAGYAVFDTNGNLLSDTYGNFPNANNNSLKQFDAFAPYTPQPVIVAAVNAQGKMVPNSGDITLYLRSNNANSRFLDPSTMHSIRSVQLQAGSKGVTIGYVNRGGASLYDVLDVSLTDPEAVPVRHVTPVPSHARVEAATQTQTASVAGATAQESQKAVVKSDVSHTPGTPIAQTTTVTQDTDSEQHQSVDVSNTSNLQQNQASKVSAQQNTPTADASQPSATVEAKQQESATGDGPIQLSQSQSVTVLGPVINVAFSQDGTVDKVGVKLTESVGVEVSPSTNNAGYTVVNVTYQGTQRQYVLDTSGSITVNESQSVDTSQNSDIHNSASIDYQVGAATHHITVAD